MMTTPTAPTGHIADQVGSRAFAADVLEGLSRPQKFIPSRWLYDARGSALFEDITELAEYYPTRTELGILPACARTVADDVGPDAVLVEFGSGSSRKTEILIEALPDLAAYLAIDISDAALADAGPRLAERFPDLDVRLLVADFNLMKTLPADTPSGPRLGFFPGSTIGNLDPEAATSLLRSFARILGTGSTLVIGVDLQKSLDVLIPAYDDAPGVTAAFNLNLLARINRELGGTFDLEAFRHEARYNDRHHRIEMHLVSQRQHDVAVCGRRFTFRRGETIHTENSYKYTLDGFAAMARTAGWHTRQSWTDDAKLFSLHELIYPN